MRFRSAISAASVFAAASSSRSVPIARAQVDKGRPAAHRPRRLHPIGASRPPASATRSPSAICPAPPSGRVRRRTSRRVIPPRPADGNGPSRLRAFKVTLYAGGDNGPLQARPGPPSHMARRPPGTFTQPRLHPHRAQTATSSLADSGAGIIDRAARRSTADGTAQQVGALPPPASTIPSVIALLSGRDIRRYVYIGNATTVVRFAYKSGDLHASGPAETIVARRARLRAVGRRRPLDAAMWPSPKMANICSSPSAPPPTSTMLTNPHPRVPPRRCARVHARRQGLRRSTRHGHPQLRRRGPSTPSPASFWFSVNERDKPGQPTSSPDYVTSVPEGSFFRLALVLHWAAHRDPRLLPRPLRRRHPVPICS